MKNFILWATPIYAILSLSSMAGMNIGFLVVFLALIAGWVATQTSPFRLSPEPFLKEPLKDYRLYGLALFFACVVSLLCAQFFPFAYADHFPDVTWHGYQKIWYLICPAVLLTVFRYTSLLDSKEKSFERILKAWWVTTLVLFVMAVIQFFTGWPLPQPIPTNPGYFHAILLMGHHLSVSSIVIFPTFTAFAIALGHFTRSRELSKLETGAAVAGLLILFLTYARTSWLAIPIGIVLIFARNLNVKKLGIFSVGLLLALGALTQTSFIKSRIENTMGIQDRFRLWEANIDFFTHRPITGIGWLKTNEMSEFYFKQLSPEHYHDYFWGHAHSNFFEMLGGTGLIGLIAFLAWSYFTLKLAYQTSLRARAFKQDRLSDFAWGIFVALILLHFNGLTNVTFWEGKVMHQQMFGVGLLLMAQLLLKDQSNMGER